MILLDLMALSAVAEKVLAALAVGVSAVLCLHKIGRWYLARRTGTSHGEEKGPCGLPSGFEGRAFALILLFGILIRVLGWDSLLTPPFYAAEVTLLHLERILAQENFWSVWKSLFHLYQVSWEHDSAVALPVAMAFRLVFGPHPHLPVLIGAWWGALSIFFAWLLGRALHSRAFGLLFAAFLAVSPLQLAWSRIGGIYCASVPHILLAMWLGFLAGKKFRPWLSLIAAACAWLSLHQYMGARIALPLTLAAMIYGLTVNPESARRKMLAAAALLLSFVAIYRISGIPHWRAALWPQYPGYLGNRGENNFSELISRNADAMANTARLSLEKYFLRDRAALFSTDAPFRWGMDHGGFCYLPAALLGGLGLLVAFRQVRRTWIWLLFLGAGFLLPVASVPTARRFLAMDAAWCAVAGLGGLYLLRFLSGPAWDRKKTVWASGLILFLGSGGWSLANLALLTARLPLSGPTALPFGDSGFGDGLACLRCFQAAMEWKGEMAKNRMVVLFDNDPYRENRTSPGGLQAYGKLAALSVGRPEHFFDFYSCLRNFDLEPPYPGRIFDPNRSTCLDYLRERMQRIRPAGILWHFESASPWEEWVASRLQSPSAPRRTFASPLGERSGIGLRTPRGEMDVPLRFLASLWEGDNPRSKSTLEIRDRATVPGMGIPLLATCSRECEQEAPISCCLIADHGRYLWEGQSRTSPFEIGAVAIAGPDAGGGPGGKLLGTWGEELSVGRDAPEEIRRIPLGRPLGLGCGAWLDGRWWTLDPRKSEVRDAGQPVPWIDRKPWVGIAADPSAGELLLLSAEQEVAVYGVADGKLLRRFPASAWPRIQEKGNECTPLLVGEGWVAAVNPMLGQVSFYDRQGLFLEKADFARRLDRLPFQFSGWGGGGGTLVVGDGRPEELPFFSVAVPPRQDR